MMAGGNSCSVVVERRLRDFETAYRARGHTVSVATASGSAPDWLEEQRSGNAAGDGDDPHRQDLNLVLVHPQIPQNAGNVARTAAATGVALHLVKPLGFDIDDKKLKRAGLDYWPYVVVKVHSSWKDFYAYFSSLQKPARLVAFSKFGTANYSAPGTYQPGDWLMFGSEIDGLPDEAHAAAKKSGGGIVKIPMRQTHVRSINLSVSVGVGVYEAIRQLDAPE
eukprot:jgi/Tetstr1/463497/TSEL_000746.t1